MNIHYINRNIQIFFFDNFSISLTSQQKKVAAIALGIFSFLAVVYCFFHFYSFKATPIELDSERHKMSEIPHQESVHFENEKIQVEEQLFVEGLDGKKWTVSILLSDTVYNLKQKIHEQSGIAIAQQRLIFKGKQLNDSATLEDCKIRKRNKILLLLKLTH